MRRNRSLTTMVVLVKCAFLGMLLVPAVLSCGSRGAAPAPGRPARSEPAASAAAATSADTSFDRLVGRWLRADGGYVLEIRAVTPEGRVDASYLNPRPINVAHAEAARGGDIVTLLVELRDVNYPGSRYRLWYDAARDTLEGTYYQAAQQETYDVAFERTAR